MTLTFVESINLNQLQNVVDMSEDDDDSPHGNLMLMRQLAPIKPYLDDPEYTEIIINRPNEIWLEGSEGWTRYTDIETLSLDWILSIGKQIASFTSNTWNDENPYLSAMLPTGERVQMVRPPVVPDGTVSLTLRKPSKKKWSLKEMVENGLFKKTKFIQSRVLDSEERGELEADLPDWQKHALSAGRDGRWLDFFTLTIPNKANIAASGQTGAGKTSLANALIDLIPKWERLITAEDVREAKIDEDMNFVNMVYKTNVANPVSTPKKVFESCLRMRPDRVLPAELRGDETFYFIQNVLNSGHPGTITTAHANSAKLFFLRLSLMIKTSPEGAGLTRDDILSMLYMLIDVVVQIVRDDKGIRSVSEIYYDPAFAQKQLG